MKYKTCISVAEKTLPSLKKSVNLALAKSDYVEIRLDFLKVEKIPETLDMIKKHSCKLVCTLRPKSEGGMFMGTSKERISILKLIAEYNPFLLDVEFNTLNNNKLLIRYLKSTKTDLLVSWHDFKGTPDLTELGKKMTQMSKLSSNIKIVCTSNSINDSSRMLELYGDIINRKNINLIAFSMGELGRITRILCLYLGSPYTYVSLGKAVAPGQFSIDEITKILTASQNH